MIGLWRFEERPVLILIVMLFSIYQNWGLCFSLNDEGLALLRIREKVESDPFGALSNWVNDDGVDNPCFWFGVECSYGNVVALNLKDLCLGGTLAPEFGNLVHIKSIILRNNSLHGCIPNELGKLKELEVLDLRYNNLSGPLPHDLGNNLSLAMLLLDHNDLFGSTTPEINELRRISEAQVDESQLSNVVQRSSFAERTISRNIPRHVDATRMLLQIPVIDFGKLKRPSTPVTETPSPPSSPSLAPVPSNSPNISVPSPEESPNILSKNHNKNHLALILSIAIGVPVLLLFIVMGFLLCKRSKIAAVRPWRTGLSGQLQKVFVTGVPKLKRSELEAACEDFSNVIGSSSIGTLYKGTLSNGVEIAVASVAVGSAKDWSKNLETQFRNKIDALSKVNHKNFGNLLGYCEEDEPFTRMLVFEYSPNGTLFEHLHSKPRVFIPIFFLVLGFYAPIIEEKGLCIISNKVMVTLLR